MIMVGPKLIRKDLAILEATPSDRWVTARDISDRCGYSPKEVAYVLRILDQLVMRKQVKRRDHRFLYKQISMPQPFFYLSPCFASFMQLMSSHVG